MFEFLQIVYSIGFSVTLVGLGVWRIVEVVTADHEDLIRRAEYFTGRRSFTANLGRALLWPKFLWRPW